MRVRVLLGLFAGLLVLPLVVIPSASAAPSWCLGDAIVAGRAPSYVPPNLCNLVGRSVRHPASGLGVEVPAPGTSVGREDLFVGGGTAMIEVSTDLNGIVHISYDGEGDETIITDPSGPDPEMPAPLDPSACSDGAKADLGFQENDQFVWKYNQVSAPDTQLFTNRDEVQDIRDAVNNITHEDNNCGASDQVSASANYQGTTTQTADIPFNESGDCPASDEDDNNVISWGNRPFGVGATTCWWEGPIDLHHADIEISKGDGSNPMNWTFTPNQNCSGRADLESVMTHEFGHVFGLGHPSGNHANLTMSSTQTTCTAAPRTLGEGDMLMLEQKY